MGEGWSKTSGTTLEGWLKPSEASLARVCRLPEYGRQEPVAPPPPPQPSARWQQRRQGGGEQHSGFIFPISRERLPPRAGNADSYLGLHLYSVFFPSGLWEWRCMRGSRTLRDGWALPPLSGPQRSGVVVHATSILSTGHPRSPEQRTCPG